ncbi:hypothetical protein UFOVP529_38 [uncultured Caudovirales phage]|uniref:Uncharacterized protein n=1 Tax=uncultured Caudovirales phage TaxID=2100421 RepID=A0A6J5R8M3_9CAUD|nr:hypothetical protein UFOVP529_38 [uncultured Caudovirales phage]CAB4190717.1 hypothetical protein UFOVP1191_96 [uncultured Caudovirales phage]CAB4194480.1 hypothetical protein UFOVP1252_82 [uncultured Caudovirales phage]
MNQHTDRVLAAMVAARGRIVRIAYHALPATEADRAARARSVAKRATTGAMIARVKHTDTGADGGAIVTLAGRYDRNYANGAGYAVSKQGNDTIMAILSAPAEHTIDGALVPTACPNAGIVGTACESLAPRHGHRSLRTERILSIACGDENLYTR